MTAHHPGVYYLRPPAWAPRGDVRALRNGRAVTPEWGGPGFAYVTVKNVKPDDTLTLAYPLVSFEQVWGNWPSKPDLKLTIRWSGNSVIAMDPKGKGLPIDFSNLPALPPLPE